MFLGIIKSKAVATSLLPEGSKRITMGKKSKKYKEKKENREKLNGLLGKSIDDLDFSRPARRGKAPPPHCMHEDVNVQHLNASQRKRWVTQGSEIATFGQRYAYRSTYLPSLTDVSVVFIHLKGKDSGLIDNHFVSIAHASPVTEILENGDYELARFKTELAIVCKCFLQVGEEEFNRCLPNPLFDHTKPAFPPQWVLDMEETLEKIRHRDSALILYLANQVPCHCLNKLIAQAKKEEERAASEVEEEEGCDHGIQNRDDVTEEYKSDAQSQLLKFAISHSLKKDATYRDFTMFADFFNDNPSYTTSDFAAYAFSFATTIILDKKQYEWAERIVNLGLMADVYAKYGPDNVTDDMQRMQIPKKPQMAPYLRDLYVEMRKTDAFSSLVRLLQKKIPCECLDELRTIIHGEGSDRSEVCNVCFKPYPKSQFLMCSACDVEEYCSPECHKQDWGSHKVMCKCLASALKK